MSIHPAPAYVPRVVDGELSELLPSLPALSIEGPKGVGKTETALRVAGSVHRLDDPQQRVLAQADPRRLTTGRSPVLIDEWQRVPESWDLVRRAVDEGPAAGRFLLTGSSAPIDTPLHTGAGRIVTVRMRPMALAERIGDASTVSLADLLSGERPSISTTTDVDLEQYVDEIVRSGFPAIRRLEGRALRAQLDGYISRIVEREFEEMGQRIRRPTTLRRWMSAYAASTALTTSYAKIRDAATGGDGNKPSRSTTQPYRAVLERLWIVDPVPAWLPTHNHIRQLAAAPKHHLADPALAARLLGAGPDALLTGQAARPLVVRDGTLAGQLFESLVTLGVRTYAQAAEARVGHLRTQGGRREVDLIVERADGRIVAIEVKLARTIRDNDAANLHWLGEQLGDDLLDSVIVTTGPEAYRRNDGIAVVPAALLGP